ncbi:MAG: hypothetical protein ABH875_03805 [Candidatus Omnitrophota bacterium]
MRIFVALLIVFAFVLGVLSSDAAYAGWKENHREKYSKKTVVAGSAQEKKIKTLANMDFTYNKNWKYNGARPESNDKFNGYNANFTPANIATGEVREEKVGYTLTGIIKDAGKYSGEKLDISKKGSDSVK